LMLEMSTACRVYPSEVGTTGSWIVRVPADDCTLFATPKESWKAGLKRYTENTAGSPAAGVQVIVTEPPEETLVGVLS